MAWQEIAAEKRSRIAASIPPEWRVPLPPREHSIIDYPRTSDFLSSEELEITESNATDLIAKIAAGELTSVAVTTAFLKRAALAHQLVNCVVEFFPKIALTRARELDDYYAKTGRTVGPLHGLPISLKDQLHVAGLETSMGYVSWIGRYATEAEESVMTTLLRKAGAVFYVKTNVPQSLMRCETVNNIIGRTVNPRNKTLSAGGSSGGEAALLALRGAVIGVGSDIAGSIRVPAAFNFLYGLRPSHGRFPYAKMANSMEGQEAVPSVVGPLAHSVKDMRLFVTSILAEEPWKFDSRVLPMPWREPEEEAILSKISSGGLTIGYYSYDGVVLPHPPVLRGMELVISTLKRAGHHVMEWSPYKHSYAHNLALDLYLADAGTDILRTLQASGEPSIGVLDSDFEPLFTELSLDQYWGLNLKKWAYQSEYLEQFRLAEEKIGREIDAIIAPTAPTASVRHDKFKYAGYTSVISVLDFTSVVVPVMFADKDVDGRTEYRPKNAIDWGVREEYDAEAYHGAPVAVQIIGRRLTEERVMAIAEEVGRLLGNEVAS